MEHTWEVLIHSDAFSCAVCKKIPRTPLWLSPDEKNVCDNCYDKESDKYTGAIKNVALNWIMEKMSFPCAHSDRGCGKVLMYERYHEHVSECPHTETCCLLGECAWVGTRQQLLMHLFEDHPDSTISEVDGAFPISCSEDVLDTKYFIQTKAGRVILRMKRDSDMLRIVIYSCDEIESSTGQLILQYRTGPSSTAQHVCTVCNDIDCLTRFSSNYTTEVNLNEKLDASSVQLVYKANKPTIPRELMKYCRCYDCHDITAIKWECDKGHSVCDHCSSNTGHQCSFGILEQGSLIRFIENEIPCANCKTKKGSFWGLNTYRCDNCQDRYSGNGYVKVRTTHVLNNFIDEFDFPCRFEAQGCRFVGPTSRNHEATCDYFEVTCPAPRCDINYRYSKLLSHMTQNHQDYCTVQDTKQFSLDVSQCKGRHHYYFLCFNMLFIYSLEEVNSMQGVYSYRWTVQEVSGRRNSNFLFTVDIPGSKSLKVTYVCGETLTLGEDILDGFAYHGQIKYSIKITEKTY